MKKKRVAIINLIIAFLVFVFTLGYAFSWLAEEGEQKKFLFDGSSGSAYFAGGDGTKENPYLIRDQYHLYNLAWLQDIGSFNKRKLYFALDANVSIDTSTWLPPIGTDEDPFVSEFDGRGYTISGLKITTDRSKLTRVPPKVNTEGFAFSRAVGFFGKTGNKAGEEKSDIHNFILDNPLVEVASANAPYSDDGNYVAGLAIGSVAGRASSIGVLATDNGLQATQLNVLKASSATQYSTFNSIIGEIAAKGTAAVTGGGFTGSGGSGNVFGASLDIDTIYDRIKKIAMNKFVATTHGFDEVPGSSNINNMGFLENPDASILLPSLDTANQLWTLAAGHKLPFTVTGDSTYVGNKAKEIVANNNVGYLLGHQNKFTHKQLIYTSELVDDGTGSFTLAGSTQTPAQAKKVPNWFYKYNPNDMGSATYSKGFGFEPISNAEFDLLPNAIKELVGYFDNGVFHQYAPNTTVSYDTIRIQAKSYGDSNVYGNNGQTSFYGGISWMGKTYGYGYRNPDGYAVDENGNFYMVEHGTRNLIDLDGDGICDTMDANGYMAGGSGFYTNVPGLYAASIRSDGVALDEKGDTYKVNLFLADDSIGGWYYKEGENGVKYYLISTAGWNDPITIMDPNGYARVTSGGYYYNKNYAAKEGVYLDSSNYVVNALGEKQVKQDRSLYSHAYFDAQDRALVSAGSNIYLTYIRGAYVDADGYMVDATGNNIIRVGASYIAPEDVSSGYAKNGNGLYYTAIDGKYINSAGYFVHANGNYYVDGSDRTDISMVDANGYVIVDDIEYSNGLTYNIYLTNNSAGYDIYAGIASTDTSATNQYQFKPMADNYIALPGNTGNGYTVLLGDMDEYWNMIQHVSYDTVSDENSPLHGVAVYRYNADGETVDSNDYHMYAGTHAAGDIVRDKYGFYVTSQGAYNPATNKFIPYMVNAQGKIAYAASVAGVDNMSDTSPNVGDAVEMIAFGNQWNRPSTTFAPLSMKASSGITMIQATMDDPAASQKIEITTSDLTPIKAEKGATEGSGANTVYLDMVVGVNDLGGVSKITGRENPGYEECNYTYFAGGVALPTQGIWFKPDRAGTIRLVTLSDSGAASFQLQKITRTRATLDNPFNTNSNPGSLNCDLTTGIEIETVIFYNIPSYVFFYLDYEIPQADIDAGNIEYVITYYNNNSPFFFYLDLGASAADETDTNTVDRDNYDVSAIDFIYDNVKINQTAGIAGIRVGDFIVVSGGSASLYNATATSVYFDKLQTVLNIVYLRINGETPTLSSTKTISVRCTDATGSVVTDKITATRINHLDVRTS